MFGYLLGNVHKQVVLIKIFVNDKNVKPYLPTLNKENLTYLTLDFKLVEITDEYLNNYISADIKVIISEKTTLFKNFKLNEKNDKNRILFYATKERALCELYMYTSKATGVFKQYSLSGELIGELPLINGMIHGIYKTYYNGIVTEECKYIKGNRINNIIKN